MKRAIRTITAFAAVAAISGAGVAYADFAEAPQSVKMRSNTRVVSHSPLSMPEKMSPFKKNKLTGIALFDKPEQYKPVIYGMMLYSDSWADLPNGSAYPYGCYAYSPKWNNAEEAFTDPNLNANGGGCYANRKIYYRMYEMNAQTNTFRNFYMVADTDNWTFVQNPILTSVDNTVANDMTYDPVTNNIYAAVYGNFDGGFTRLAIVDKTTGECTEIATLPDLVCLVANNFGELYGVENGTGTTYRIDKVTGKYIKVGNSGVIPKFAQSACIDPETNQIYWTACLADGTSGVYLLDQSTGKATLKTALKYNPEFTCTFIEADTQGLDAPAAVTDFVITRDGDKSVANFTIPSDSFDGTRLFGTLTAKLLVDGEVVYSEPASRGAKLSIPFEVGSGNHTVLAYAENAEGAGCRTFLNYYTGVDVPAAPANTLLTVADGVATLTWNAPETGLNGGVIDTSTLSYNIVRYPGKVEVATGFKGTSFTETLPKDLANYYYTVTAYSGSEAGGTATSNSFYSGTVVELPCNWTFDTAAGMNGFTILDGDGDENTWTYSDFNKCVWSKFNKTEQENDWLITPPLATRANSTYQVTFKAKAFDKDNTEKFEVKAGKAPTIEGMTVQVMAPTTTSEETYKTYSGTFKTDADGVMYVGFHAMSPANSYRLLVDNIEIKLVAASDIPDAVTDLKATSAVDGSNDVTLSFKAPTNYHGGKPLDALTEIKIFRGLSNNPVYIVSYPSPGQEVTWTDRNAESGENTYRVIAYNAAGAGVEATVKAYAGLDAPAPVTDVKVEFTADRKAIISWKAPTTTVNGSPVNPDLLTYRIWRNDGQTLISGTKATAITDLGVAEVDQQITMYYAIYPSHGSVEGAGASSNFFLTGNPYKLPFAESFPSQQFNYSPWTRSCLSGQRTELWTLSKFTSNPEATAQDNDSGFITFLSYDRPNGLTERLTSPKIDLEGVKDAKLSFYFYHMAANVKENMEIYISHNDGVFTKFAEVPLKGDKAGWTLYSFPVSAEHAQKSTMFAFQGTTAQGYNMHIDNIRVSGTYSGVNDLEGDGWNGDLNTLPESFRADVYTTSGATVKIAATPAELRALPSGLYILRTAKGAYKLMR